MRGETLRKVVDTLRQPKTMLALGGVGLLSAAGCGTGLDTKHVELCTTSEAKGHVATLGTHDENDPDTLLNYAGNHEYADETSGWITRNMQSRTDQIDGLGEMVCQVRTNGNVELHFIPQGEEIRGDYIHQQITDSSNVRQEVGNNAPK